MKRILNLNHQTAQPGHGSRGSAGEPGTGRPRNGEGVGEGVGERGRGREKETTTRLLRWGKRGSDRRMAGCSISRRVSRGLLSKHRLLRWCPPVSCCSVGGLAGWRACWSARWLAGRAFGSQMMAPMGGSGTTTSIGTVVRTWLGHVADPREAQGSAATATVPPANHCARGVACMSRLATVYSHTRRACVAVLGR